MKYAYYLCDVFTRERFGGNQLAVLPDARGLDTAQMQQIAREFNFSESTFVFPPEAGHTRKVRIFTPGQEVPFAGHPNIGTAFVLASGGELGEFAGALDVVFEEKAGLVPVTVRRSADGEIDCELQAPEQLSLGPEFSAETIADALSLAVEDIVTATHLPVVASVGLECLLVEVAALGGLQRARANLDAFERIAADGVKPFVHVYLRSNDQFDIRSRMFAPLDGIPEDPATGSANCALAALLAHHDPLDNGQLGWSIAQGVEMGRPSLMRARAGKAGGEVTGVWIGGPSVLVAEGQLIVDAP
jgi:trans-2,3-dihydro-3-hydroxyanthranilate isomerase